MRTFEYHRAISIEDACSILSRYGSDARILAGGQSLLNMMKWRLAAPNALIDVSRIAALKGIQESNGKVRIGSMVTYNDLQKFAPIKSIAIIQDALEVIADLQVRNLGTLGGSCCQADPFGDMPNVMIALDATMEATSTQGSREIRAREFFRGPLETSLQTDEVLTSILIDGEVLRQGSAYEKFSWRKGDYAIVSVASIIGLEADGRCTTSRIVVGGLGVGPVELLGAANALLGHMATEDLVKEAAQAAAAECQPESDRVYGSAEYKKLLIETIADRSLERSLRRARDIVAGDSNE
ncbi:FAD binding domain-containing protein [Pseudolabrys sp.]|uniref:FAD binding domain-containing protein n=1 Tax=Pseudolabrys sp. TaxID=1960880 RepID=UPI003D136C76